MQHDIHNYMTPGEAAHIWNVPETTLKSKLQPKTSRKVKEQLEIMIEQGLVKFFIKPGGQRKEWIISREAMKQWFGEIGRE